MGYPDFEEQIQRARNINEAMVHRNIDISEPERTSRVIATGRVLQEVWYERDRQDSKWGQQNHPVGNLPTPLRCGEEARAKQVCDSAAKNGTLDWVDIIDEEYREFAAAETIQAARAELVQLAAVAVAAVERIDRLLRDHTPAEGHNINADTIGGCSPSQPCPACVARMAKKGK